jgi:hypothetical protein
MESYLLVKNQRELDERARIEAEKKMQAK